jgi:hypothetical protein
MASERSDTGRVSQDPRLEVVVVGLDELGHVGQLTFEDGLDGAILVVRVLDEQPGYIGHVASQRLSARRIRGVGAPRVEGDLEQLGADRLVDVAVEVHRDQVVGERRRLGDLGGGSGEGHGRCSFGGFGCRSRS